MVNTVKANPRLPSSRELHISFKFKLLKKFTLTLNLVLLVKVFRQRAAEGATLGWALVAPAALSLRCLLVGISWRDERKRGGADVDQEIGQRPFAQTEVFFSF